MRTKILISMLVMIVATIAFSLNEANAGFPVPPGLPAPPGFSGSPNVNVRVNGFLPAPPGVRIMMDSDRPYYVERNRRVYMERERPRHYKKYKKHHEDRGHGHGRD